MLLPFSPGLKPFNLCAGDTGINARSSTNSVKAHLWLLIASFRSPDHRIIRSQALLAALLRDGTRPLVGLPDGEAADTMLNNILL